MSQSKIFKVPNGLRKAKSGSGRAKLDPKLLKRAEQAIEKVQRENSDWATGDLALLDTLVSDLQSGEGSQAETMKELFRLSLDMKGLGGSFGFLMMSEVAASLTRFIEDRDLLCPLDIEVIAAHVSTLRAVYVEEVRDDGGNTGRALIVGLEKLVAKAQGA